METEWNLSDKIVDTDYSGTPYNLKEKGIETSDEDFLIVKDVREFIKRLKKIKVGIETSIMNFELSNAQVTEAKILRLTGQVRELFESELNKLAGEKLI